MRSFVVRITVNRQNQTLPVLLTPWENGKPLIEESTMAITKDISDQGVSLILNQPFRDEQVVIGFWPSTTHTSSPNEESFFFLGDVRQNVGALSSL